MCRNACAPNRKPNYFSFHLNFPGFESVTAQVPSFDLILMTSETTGAVYTFEET